VTKEGSCQIIQSRIAAISKNRIYSQVLCTISLKRTQLKPDFRIFLQNLGKALDIPNQGVIATFVCVTEMGHIQVFPVIATSPSTASTREQC
jgi:porphobilinogen deaminase